MHKSHLCSSLHRGGNKDGNCDSVLMNNRAPVERPPYPWRYLNRTGPQTQKLRGVARKGYGFSFAVPPPYLIARGGGKKPASRPRNWSSQRPYQKHQRYPIGRPIFSTTCFPYTKRPLGLRSRTILLVLIVIFDLFITLSTSISRPIGYFCPVLTADGKVDCAPK
jgi:hypothetical protein